VAPTKKEVHFTAHFIEIYAAGASTFLRAKELMFLQKISNLKNIICTLSYR
jgi:hypothetical protein